MQNIDFFTATAREMKAQGFDLIVDEHKAGTTNQTVTLICLPSHRKIAGHIGLLTIEADDITNTAEVTGSSFDYAGPGVRRMNDRIERTETTRRAMAKALTPSEYTPAQMATALVETMEAAGYAA